MRDSKMTKKWRPILMQLMFTLGLPLVYFGAFTLLHAEFFLKECDRLGDYPLLTLEIQRAADFKALLGPYSRHGFNHPGPFSLYVFALGERLLFFIKSFYGRYALTQLLMSLVFISGSLRLIYRHFGAAQSAFAFTTILLYFAAERRTSFFCDIWGPALLPSAMLAFLCTSAALATGNLKPFLLWSIAFSVLASNHLGTWPVVGPISVFALGKGVPNINKHATKIDRPTKLSIAAGLLVILAAALPPLIELIIKPGLGNLGKILHFSLYRTENKPFPQSLAFLVSFYDLNLGLFALPGFILFPMLTLICFLVKLPRWQFAWNLRAAILACPFLVLPGILKIRGELHAFILWHQYAVAALLLTCSAHGLMLVFPQLRVGFSKYATTAFLSAALVISMLWTVRFAPPKSCRTAEIFEEVVTALNLEKDRLYILESTKGDVGVVRYALFALALKRNGYEFCVLPKWEYIFGEDVGCRNLAQKPRWRHKTAKLRLYSPKSYSLSDLPGAMDLGGLYVRRLES